MEHREASIAIGRRREYSQVGLQVQSVCPPHNSRYNLLASELPNYDVVVPALLNVGVGKLREECKLTPGVPLKPMLAKPTKAIGEVLDRFEDKRFTCEYKYDGERAQVHKLADGTVGVFSRNSEDMSKKYPDLIEQLPHVGSWPIHEKGLFSLNNTVHQGKHENVCVGRRGCGDRSDDGQAHAIPRTKQAEAERCESGRHPNSRVPLCI